MTLLGNINKNEELEERDCKYSYGIYKKHDRNDISLGKCIFIFSPIFHIAMVCLFMVIVLVMKILGINLSIFDKPQPKPKDIEFVLVNKEAQPINKNTKYRADKNSRAGGQHDPNRPVSQPVVASKASKPQKAVPHQKQTSQKNNKLTQNKPVQQPKKQENKKQETKKAPVVPQMPFAPKTTTSVPKPQGVPKVEAPAPKPALTPSAPKTTKPNGSFNIPAPKTTLPKVAGPSGGPITGSKTGSGSPSGSSSGKSAVPAPSFSPSGAGSAGGRFSPGSSGNAGSAGRSGNVGNPGPGNPKGTPGIDAIKEPDFGPYMRDLQRRIKMNWEPPKGNESKRVVLLFTIARDGRLISHRVYKSSGLQAADRAAMHAVELTAPFKPLPPEYKGNSIDIQFTFDYNVFGPTNY